MSDRHDGGRRQFIRISSSAAMATGLAASYGTLAVYAGRFLYPADELDGEWQFVAELSEIKTGDSFTYISPLGAQVVIARQGDGDTPDDFMALSSVCPHLGCRVHWEAHNDRFFCPCHNGVFDRQGQAIAGPPAQSGQQLNRYSLKVENSLLYIQVPLQSVTEGSTA